MGRVAIIGAKGQVGSDFSASLGARGISISRAQADLGRSGEVVAFLDDLKPAVVVNCAAHTKVDLAESEEDLATEINGAAVGAIAEWAQRCDVPFVTYSTDYVFDGHGVSPYVESSPTKPVNAYGRSKLVGEKLALAAGALVVRTSWVVSGTHPNFIATMLARAKRGQPSRVVNDQVGSPTVTHDLVRGSLLALQAGVTGLLHLTNSGHTSWYELARTSVEMAGLDPELVTPCRTDEYPTVAARPVYSVLESERAPTLGLAPLPRWQDSLPQVVDELMTWA